MEILLILKDGQEIQHDDVALLTYREDTLIVHVDFGSDNLAKEEIYLKDILIFEVKS